MKLKGESVKENDRAFVVENKNKVEYFPVSMCMQPNLQKGLKIPPKNRWYEIDKLGLKEYFTMIPFNENIERLPQA